MITITAEFKTNVKGAIAASRSNYSGSDKAFAKSIGLHPSIYSRLKNGEEESIISDAQWLNIGRCLHVQIAQRKWVMVRTEVVEAMEEEMLFCKEFSKAKIFVDEPEIGKTYTAEYMARTHKNTFYIDASQAKTKQVFIRLLAQKIGVDEKGKYVDVKAAIKYFLRCLPSPLVIIDEAGDLEYPAFLELKELWNATDGACGWYLIGAEGLQAKMDAGIGRKKVGFKEIFSRYSGKYSSIVPKDRSEKINFYKQLLTSVVTANTLSNTNINSVVKRCLTTDGSGYIGGLRRAESLLILTQNQA